MTRASEKVALSWARPGYPSSCRRQELFTGAPEELAAGERVDSDALRLLGDFTGGL
jgi:hypothetical protein